MNCEFDQNCSICRKPIDACICFDGLDDLLPTVPLPPETEKVEASRW